jgi:hypothetical protein
MNRIFNDMSGLGLVARSADAIASAGLVADFRDRRALEGCPATVLDQRANSTERVSRKTVTLTSPG